MKQLSKLDRPVARRIFAEVQAFGQTGQGVCKRVEGMGGVTHRVRVGDYRALINTLDDGDFEVVKVAHRREVYR